jgi:hypothetical protein
VRYLPPRGVRLRAIYLPEEYRLRAIYLPEELDCALYTSPRSETVRYLPPQGVRLRAMYFPDECDCVLLTSARLTGSSLEALQQ